ncbi:MAG TPA: PKD domain-containing protein [Candidatus Acidoferrales bacterium]|nr:PKD domain-containing protein [Candidatus Acidoferrales bacterium]
MLRLAMRGVGLLVLLFLLVPAGFSKSPAKKPKKSLKKTDDAASTSPASGAEKTDETAASATPSTPAPAPPAQNAANDKKSETNEYTPPRFLPMLATSGTLGLFTVETADTLPKGAFAFSAFGNKFGRMPGSVTILQIGLDASYGISDRLNAYASFDPYQHAHIGCGQQLSLAPPNQSPFATPVGNSIYNSIQTVPTPPCTGNFNFPVGTAGYVEDYPFAANDTGGLGNVTLGLKYAFLSQRLGDGISLSVRNDLIISTKTDLNKLLANGTQGSPLSDLVSVGLSRQWSNVVTATFNFGYMLVRAPRDSQGNKVLDLPDQLKMGAGLLFMPESRIQPMVEYTGTIFSHAPGYIPNTTFGARDPVDSVSGVRLYPKKFIALDVGYRYMVNLKDLNDRHGFVVKLGTAYWPSKAPPVNHPPTISCTTDKDMVYLDSGDPITVTCNASDPDNDPLTYTWSSTCGRVDGNGPQVRWLSAGTAVGPCSITAKVDDGRGGYASSTVNVRVEAKPYHPPTISCSADRSSVFAGEKVHITTNANSPDGLPLQYTWRTSGGQIAGSGAAADLDTTGLAPGNYTVTVRVDDGRSGADCSSTVEVKPVPPPPQASKISDCAFGKPLSTRIDNVCKRILDDVALRLQNEPRATTVIIGYSDPKEAKPAKIAGDRATNAVKYLGEKGIDASRTSTRAGSGQAGATDNRRIDIIFVPEGATY